MFCLCPPAEARRELTALTPKTKSASPPRRDLADLKIGVQTGTTGDLQATDIVKDDTQMNRFNTGADAVQALKNGKVDCVVIDSQPAAKFVELNDDLEIIDGIFETEEYAICLKKGNTELQEEIKRRPERAEGGRHHRLHYEQLYRR